MSRPRRNNFVVSSTTNSFPEIQARELRSSCLGTWPNWATLFSRLNTNSICQRLRYDSRTTAAEPLERVVNKSTYLANSSAPATVGLWVWRWDRSCVTTEGRVKQIQLDGSAILPSAWREGGKGREKVYTANLE